MSGKKKKEIPQSPRAALREALVSEKLAGFQIICSVCRIPSHSCQLLRGFLGRRKVFQCQGLIGGGPRFSALARKEQEVVGLSEVRV